MFMKTFVPATESIICLAANASEQKDNYYIFCLKMWTFPYPKDFAWLR